MSMDSAEDHGVGNFSAQTMDSWAWIGRARAAARRAMDSTESAEPSPAEDPPAGGPGRRAPPAG